VTIVTRAENMYHSEMGFVGSRRNGGFSYVPVSISIKDFDSTGELLRNIPPEIAWEPAISTNTVWY